MYEIVFAIIVLALLVNISSDLRRIADKLGDHPGRDEGVHELLMKLRRSVEQTNELIRQGSTAKPSTEGAEQGAG